MDVDQDKKYKRLHERRLWEGDGLESRFAFDRAPFAVQADDHVLVVDQNSGDLSRMECCHTWGYDSPDDLFDDLVRIYNISQPRAELLKRCLEGMLSGAVGENGQSLDYFRDHEIGDRSHFRVIPGEKKPEKPTYMPVQCPKNPHYVS